MYALEKKEISASTATRCKNSPWLGVEQNNPSNSSIFMEHPVHTYIHTHVCVLKISDPTQEKSFKKKVRNTLSTTSSAKKKKASQTISIFCYFYFLL